MSVGPSSTNVAQYGLAALAPKPCGGTVHSDLVAVEFAMRPSPSIVPGIDRDVCMVLDDFGPIGRAWSEINVEDTDFETVITNLLDGRFSNPIRVVAFNTAEGWSRDVSEVVALELRVRCANQGRELPDSVQRFVERYESARASSTENDPG